MSINSLCSSCLRADDVLQKNYHTRPRFGKNQLKSVRSSLLNLSISATTRDSERKLSVDRNALANVVFVVILLLKKRSEISKGFWGLQI